MIGFIHNIFPDGGTDDLRQEMRELREENKRIREELLSAIRNQTLSKKDSARIESTSETEPLYDTLDEEGNIVPEPPREEFISRVCLIGNRFLPNLTRFATE